MISKVETAEAKINFENYQTIYTKEIEAIVEKLSTKLEIPVMINGGMMMQREIFIKKRVNQWLQAEITPLLYEIWELRDSMTNGARMIFINLKNQLSILSTRYKEGGLVNSQSISTAAISSTFLEQLEVKLHSIREYSQNINERLDESFFISTVFDLSTPFLKTETQTSINQLRLNQNQVSFRVREWWKKQVLKVNQFQSSVEKEEQLSVSEKVVRYIKSRKSEEVDSHYQNIFLTKGYVGEAFWIGREEQIARVGEIINNWRDGFRGAILLTGSRLSGKSLFGEVISKRFFFNHTYRLSPNSQIDIGGRKTEVGYDLEKILMPIKDFSKDKAILVWIDDLELWWDIDVSLNKNIRTLKKYMDSYAHEIFFVVSIEYGFQGAYQSITQYRQSISSRNSDGRYGRRRYRKSHFYSSWCDAQNPYQ